VQKRILPLAITSIAIFSLIGWNCTKLDTTTIGSDVLPAVDNVNTFDTILAINSTQGIFNDSVFVGKYDDHALGAINNDPLFGKTNASILMQIKPPFYRYYFGNAGDTINGTGVGLDSVVLCLKYTGFWGDSTVPINLEVRQINDNYFRDSVFKDKATNYMPNLGSVIGSATVDVTTLGNYIKYTNGRDSVNRQVRIKLSTSFASLLFSRDSTSNPVNNAFFNDSIYRRFYPGIAVLANGGGNGLMYINLADTSTKLEIHYRKKKNGVIDSVYSSFRINPSFSDQAENKPVSATGNHVLRTRAGYPISNPASTEHYLQTAPGTYINLNIPGLATLSNRVIHRAEIIIEQIPTDPVMDNRFSPPAFLYLDLKDTGTVARWKPIYFDLNTSVLYDPDFRTAIPYIANPIDYQYFGGYKRDKRDVFGNGIKYYNFNISRYVQQIVTDRTPSYDMRVYAPFNLSYPQYSTSFIPYSNNIAYGRVRIGSGSNPNYKLRLRIVYSKL
jgi:Domain of unknown function (DUF4270)